MVWPLARASLACYLIFTRPCSSTGPSSLREQPDSFHDALVLVQSAVQSHLRSTLTAGSQSQSHLQSLARAASGITPFSGSAVNCKAYPGLCEAPFWCNKPVSPVEVFGMTGHIAWNGHANLRSWCLEGQLAGFLNECIVNKDLRMAAHHRFQWNLNRSAGVDEMDASYCFMEGHCTNSAVTENTTVADAEGMCTNRLGHKGWAEFGLMHVAPMFLRMALGNDHRTGFRDPKITQLLVKLACAQGTYHCDVMYCRETYCKKDYYVKKYGHLLPKTPGHLIQQHEEIL